ncbi:DUF4271 domain-containing protein [Marinilongibacter aquaticus]|uniref:DUF4271 domain-containing protein n=1 Tax=Marinilongibacter aquaticus TaxID=2975157 RepID=UPI0021BDF00F|nr:DUF4271 domain-containing protein [Marinilongibacter aquaticus]UBM58407.1 DUF4271 domain-containing protein [Marinilongibacter aquaticus]
MIKGRLLLGLLFFLFAQLSRAQELPDSTYHIIQNFGKDWFVFDEDTEEYLPFTNKLSRSHQAHSVFVDYEIYKQYHLLVRDTENSGLLFIDGKVFGKLKAKEWKDIPLSQIAHDDEQMVVTLYGSRNIAAKNVLIGTKKDLKERSSPGIFRENILVMKHRLARPFRNSSLLLLCFVFVYTALLGSTNPKAFNEYFSLGELLTVKIRDTKFLISKPMHRTNQAFAVLLGLCTALIFIVLSTHGVYLFNNVFNISNETSSLEFFGIFVFVAIVSYLLYIGKFVFLNIMAQLFGIGKTVNVHYHKSIQFTLLFFSFLVLGTYLYSMHIGVGSKLNADWVFYLLLSGYLIRTLLVYLSILKSTGMQSLYLIAYLCVVEILPITLGIRLAF